jgi:hypothetical protein
VQRVAHQDEAGGLHRHVRARPDRNADVRLCQSRAVVDAVADERNNTQLWRREPARAPEGARQQTRQQRGAWFGAAGGWRRLPQALDGVDLQGAIGARASGGNA